MESPALQVAKEQKTAEAGVHVLSTGVRVRFHPVAAGLVAEVSGRVQNPEVPMWHNPEKDRDEPNPNDPDYLAALSRANIERGNASMDALMLFGVELVDGLPESDAWVRKLKRVGIEVDASDEAEREFAYIKYIAFAAPDLPLLQAATGIPEAAIEKAARSFRSDAERRAD